MGSYLTKIQEEVTKQIQAEYHFQAEPYLLHKQTQQLCTLHKVTSNSAQQADKIIQIIEQYERTKCESISKLRSHYRMDNTGYCSDQQNFYFIFDGQNNYNIREEITKRRLYRTPFGDREVEQIITTLLCGLREYDMRFQRIYDRLSFDSMIIDQRTNHIYLKDPWINTKISSASDGSSQTIFYYPSPEKLASTYNNKIEDFNEFLSNLFSVGVMALQLNKMEFMDELYIRKRELNYDQIKKQINEIGNERLRRGVQCLLNNNPSERKRIYQIWGIENKQKHFLQPILMQKGQSIKSPSNQTQTYNRTSKFQFPPSSHKNQATLQLVPSETILVPPLPLNQHHSLLQQPPSTRSNPPKDSSSQPYIWTTSLNYQSNYDNRAIPQYQPPSFRNSPQTPNMIYQSLPINKNVFLPIQIDQNYGKTSVSPIVGQQLPRFHQILARQQQKSSSKQLPTIQPIKIYNLQFKIPSIIPNDNKKAIFTPLPQQKNIFVNNAQSVHTPYAYQQVYQTLISNTQQKIPITQSMEHTQKQAKSNNEEKITDAPIEVRQVTSIIVQAKPQYYDVVNSTPKVDQIQQNVHSPPVLQQKKEVKKQSANSNQSQSYEAANRLPIARDNNEQIDEPKGHTPHRPTARNKYNSTIVQVREEQSPAHSSKSEPHQEQYVVEEYETGSRYEGFKSSGMRNGRGKFYYQDGGFYQGSWKNNKMDGYGKLYYEGGKLAYEGYWLQDEFNGMGKVFNDNPLVLASAFDYTNFELLEDYWEYYEGMLVHDTKEGRGKIKLSNEEFFEGDFHNDRIQGFGKFHTNDGKIIEGIWRDSKLIKVINSTRS